MSAKSETERRIAEILKRLRVLEVELAANRRPVREPGPLASAETEHRWRQRQDRCKR